MNAIETYRAQKEEINAKLSGFGQDSLKPFFLQLFEAHPDAQVVRWYQYTPHFNDGDPCVFGVATWRPRRSASLRFQMKSKRPTPEIVGSTHRPHRKSTCSSTVLMTCSDKPSVTACGSMSSGTAQSPWTSMATNDHANLLRV